MAKLADRGGTRTAVREFGSPVSLVPFLAIAIPITELIVAGALVSSHTRTVGAVGALGLLALFSGAIAVRLARGKAPECHCFGQLHSAPVSWKTLARNGVLAVVAGIALIAGLEDDTPSAVAWIQDRSATGVLLAAFVGAIALVIIAASGWFITHLLRQHGRILLRLDTLEEQLAAQGIIAHPSEASSSDGLALGLPAPKFALRDMRGVSTTLEDLLAARLPLMLVFSHPGCSPCVAMLPEIAKWQTAHMADLNIALISQGSTEDNRTATAEHGIERVLLQREREVAEAYQAYATPSAVLVSTEGIIASSVVQGAPAIRIMIISAAAPGSSDVNHTTFNNEKGKNGNDARPQLRRGPTPSTSGIGANAS